MEFDEEMEDNVVEGVMDCIEQFAVENGACYTHLT